MIFNALLTRRMVNIAMQAVPYRRYTQSSVLTDLAALLAHDVYNSL